jgi:heptosyltransferase III
VASSPAARLAAGRSVVDDHYTSDAVGLHALFSDAGGVGPRLQSLLHLTAPKLILSFLSDTAHEIHHRLVEAVAGRVASLDPRPKEGDGRHITARWTDALRKQGVNVADPEPAHIRIDQHEQDAAPSGKRVIIHPGSGGRAKCWPLERFMAVADTLRDFEIHWMLGLAECERDPQHHARLQERTAHRSETLIVEDDLLDAARHLAGAALHVGNDSGMTHLAAALGTPTVAIFGPTDPRIWRPLGDHVQIISPSQPTDIIHVETERVSSICIEQTTE